MPCHSKSTTMNTVNSFSPRNYEKEHNTDLESVTCGTSTSLVEEHSSSHTVATYSDSMTSSLHGSDLTFDESSIDPMNDCGSAPATRPLCDISVDWCSEEEELLSCEIDIPLNDDDENDQSSTKSDSRRRRCGLLQERKTWDADQRELLMDFGCVKDNDDDDEELAAYEDELLQMYQEHLESTAHRTTTKTTAVVLEQ